MHKYFIFWLILLQNIEPWCREDLLNSSWGLLNDDTLTVICELKVFQHSESALGAATRCVVDSLNETVTSN